MFVLGFTTLYMATACSGHTHALAWACVGLAALCTALLCRPGRSFDAVLRLRLPAQQGSQAAFAETLKRHCGRFVLVNLRDVGGNCLEHSYQIQFPPLTLAGVGDNLLRELNSLPDVTGATTGRSCPPQLLPRLLSSVLVAAPPRS